MDLLAIFASNAFLIGALITAAWMTRKYWGEWVAQSIRAGVEAKLESMRSQFREHESEVDAIRGTGLENVKAAQAALVQRRIRAVDDIWQAVNELATLNWTLMIMSIVKTDAVFGSIEKEPKL